MSTHAPPPVGIDLGTTLSVIAFVDRHGTPRTILNSEGELTTPSAVLFEDSSIVVGREALKAAVHEPDRVATFAKRDMGGEHYHRPISGELVPPEVVQSLVLKKLKRDAEERIGPFREAVITVPAYFNEPRRKATQDAGRLAGLDVLDIINEPTAAAIAFGARDGLLNASGQARRSERILVYDLGGGTFDVTLMELDGPNYATIATAGDVYLGGIDWDRRLVDHVAERYLERHALDPRVDESSLQRLLREAEEAKRALSSREKTSFVFEHGSEGLRVLVTREQFESLTADLLERTLFTVRRVLKDASLKWTDLTRVLLVGGSTRMPAVRRMLSVETHLPLDRSLSPDEAVAHGAAIYASLLLAERRGEPTATVRDVNSHDLGVLGTEIATGRPRAAVVIPRNTPLPATRGRRFQTARQNQRSVVVKVIEGGDAAGRHATAIGDCVIRDLPRDLPAGSPVDVMFSYARNGRLVVRACLPPLEHEAVLAVERRSGLSDEALGRWKARLDDEEGPLALG